MAAAHVLLWSGRSERKVPAVLRALLVSQQPTCWRSQLRTPSLNVRGAVGDAYQAAGFGAASVHKFSMATSEPAFLMAFKATVYQVRAPATKRYVKVVPSDDCNGSRTELAQAHVPPVWPTCFDSVM